ncbi:MAG TPA: PQQ-binding-like beta-propeller repeat protein [Planctomycetaceae bacterium]|nr:PQQ-binding-like beta-propeller repeat protein [Planctomycetaceae bacterium]
MSIKSKSAADPGRMTNTVIESAAMKSGKRGPLLSWIRVGTPLVILVLAAALEVSIWKKYEDDATYRVMLTWYTVLGFVLGLLIWWTLLSGHRWSTRLIGLAVIPIASFAFVLTFRLKDFTGDMVPVFELRWQRSAEQRAADYWQNQASEEVTPAAGKEPTPVFQQVLIRPDDWPQFNGPRRDGRADGVRVRTRWEEANPHKLSDMDPRLPRQVWRHPVGAAWSSFAIVDKFAFTQEQRGTDEAVVCYDARDGKQIWVHLDHNQRYDQPLAGIGPRATPTVHDSRVYTFGATGILNCFAASSGARLWSTNAIEDAGGQPLQFGMAGSPLVFDNLVVVNPGGPRQTIDGTRASGRAVIAYDRLTGKEVWAAGDYQAAYASPILATLGGVKQVVIFDALGAAGHDVANGKQLWRTPAWTNDFHNNIAQPIVGKDAGGEGALFLSSGYGTGSILFDVQKSNGRWNVNERWRAPNKFKLKFNSGVARDGLIYGLDEGILACFDLSTGHQRWKHGHYGYGQVLMFENLLFVISEEGDAVFVDVSSGKPQEVARFHAIDGKTWNHPAYSKGRLYLRNAEEAVCYDLEPLQPVWR